MMTPQEKWARIKNPTCADDYGLGLTLDLAEAVGKDVGEVIDKMRRDILAGLRP